MLSLKSVFFQCALGAFVSQGAFAIHSDSHVGDHCVNGLRGAAPVRVSADSQMPVKKNQNLYHVEDPSDPDTFFTIYRRDGSNHLNIAFGGPPGRIPRAEHIAAGLKHFEELGFRNMDVVDEWNFVQRNAYRTEPDENLWAFNRKAASDPKSVGRAVAATPIGHLLASQGYTLYHIEERTDRRLGGAAHVRIRFRKPPQK